jgi:hypothetical protein
MQTTIRPAGRTLTALVLAGALALALAACGGTAPSSSAGASAAPSGAPASSSSSPTGSTAVKPSAEPTQTTEPELTPVPGATADASGEPGGNGGITVIDWGTILDQVPEGFPVFPGASPTQVDDGPSSGAWFADGASVDAVASWYRAKLEGLGFTTKDLSSPLEDGSRILDTVSDLPECRIQTTFRPMNGSTIIIVLYGAGCAGGEG